MATDSAVGKVDTLSVGQSFAVAISGFALFKNTLLGLAILVAGLAMNPQPMVVSTVWMNKVIHVVFGAVFLVTPFWIRKRNPWVMLLSATLWSLVGWYCLRFMVPISDPRFLGISLVVAAWLIAALQITAAILFFSKNAVPASQKVNA